MQVDIVLIFLVDNFLSFKKEEEKVTCNKFYRLIMTICCAMYIILLTFTLYLLQTTYYTHEIHNGIVTSYLSLKKL